MSVFDDIRQMAMRGAEMSPEELDRRFEEYVRKIGMNPEPFIVDPARMESTTKEKLKPTADVSNITVEDIHKEFDQAGEEILEEANRILKEKKDYSKEKKLSDLGFIKIKSVLIAHEEDKKARAAKSLAEIVGEYKRKYPYKYITEERVNDICMKYALIFGKAEWFIGDIPEKNQQDIVNFKVDVKDRGEEKSQYHIPKGMERPSSFKIVAPQHDFDLEGKEVQGFEIKEVPLDPVVLCPMAKGGYLIVTMWGKEKEYIDER